MKVTVVPAQVTTVEDRIMGSLSLSQLLLMIIPMFIGGAMYAFLPPFTAGSPYKYLLVGILAIVCMTLAIRIKSKLVAHWIVVILRYNLRPKHYVFNKNTKAHRAMYENVTVEEEKPEATETTPLHLVPKLDLHAAQKVQELLNNPELKLRFESTKKGGLHVRLTEIEE